MSLSAALRRAFAAARVYTWRHARGLLRNIAPRYVRRHMAQTTGTTRRCRRARARIERAARLRGVKEPAWTPW